MCPGALSVWAQLRLSRFAINRARAAGVVCAGAASVDAKMAGGATQGGSRLSVRTRATTPPPNCRSRRRLRLSVNSTSAQRRQQGDSELGTLEAAILQIFLAGLGTHFTRATLSTESAHVWPITGRELQYSQ
jgi:hypothetical protein